MPEGVPAEEANDLFNKLGRMPPTDREAIGQIAWRLRALVAKQSGHLRARIALIRAMMLLGDAPEAIQLADYVWNARRLLDDEAGGTFGAQLLELGLYARFLTHAEAWKPHTLEQQVEYVHLLMRAHWGLGDLISLNDDERKLQTLAGRPMREWAGYYAEIEKEGLLPHFRMHQSIVAAHTVGWQIFSTTMIFQNDAEPADAGTFYYGPGMYAERRRREDVIHEELTSYYGSVDLGESRYWELITPVLLPTEARPSALRQRLAA